MAAPAAFRVAAKCSDSTIGRITSALLEWLVTSLTVLSQFQRRVSAPVVFVRLAAARRIGYACDGVTLFPNRNGVNSAGRRHASAMSTLWSVSVFK